MICCIAILQSCRSYIIPCRTRSPSVSETRLNDLKFDPKHFVSVSLQKPLGLSLVEVEENKESGVFVEEVNEGSAMKSNVVKKGLFLSEINGQCVKYKGFDDIMDVLIDAEGQLDLGTASSPHFLFPLSPSKPYH